MAFLITPFVKLMNRLKYPYKFALIGALLLLPFVLSMYLIAGHYEDKINIVNKERAGMRLHYELNRLASDIRSFRPEKSAGVDRKADPASTAEQEAINERIQSLIDENGRLGNPFFADSSFESLSGKWLEIRQLRPDAAPEERIERHNEMLIEIHKLMLAIADHSGTRSDMSRTTRMMAQLLTERLVPIQGKIDEAADSARLAANPASSVSASELRGIISVQVESIRTSQELFRQWAVDAEASSDSFWDKFQADADRYFKDTDAFIGLLESGMKTASPSAEEIEERSGLSIASGNSLYESVYAALEARLTKQVHNEGLKKILALLVTGAGFAVLGLLFVGFYVSVVHAVFALRQTSLEVASGHMSGRIRLGTEDELKEVENAYNRMADAYSDIMRQQEAIEDHLQRRAYYDALTGAPNRFLFHERLGDAIARAKKQDVMLGLMLIDLDGFKKINESSGHRIGDLLLRQVAERLTECLRETDTVARIDGDEFSVILPGIKDRHVAAFVADKLLRGFLTPFSVEGYQLSVSASIGISLFPDDGTDADSLMSKADMAMFSVKEQGKNGYRYYESNDRT